MHSGSRSTSENLLDADVEALVNTVNTVGVMGKGLALQFKKRFPSNFTAYAAACARGEVEIGRLLVVERAEPTGPRFIINFPTKKHWRFPSRLEYVASGLRALIGEIRSRNIRSLAVPPLGCGNGGLAWTEVKPLIECAMAELPGVHILVFPPGGPPHDLTEVRGGGVAIPQLSLPLIMREPP